MNEQSGRHYEFLQPEIGRINKHKYISNCAFFGEHFFMKGKGVHLGNGFSTISSNSSRFGYNQSCKIACLILMPFQILFVVAHKIICSNSILFLDKSS
jgi:hypothetical protein